MITADDFLAAAGRAGFDFYTGVPCSFLTPLINGVLSALLEAEINIHYIYSFIKRPEGKSALAINTEDSDVAAQALSKRGYRVLTQRDISR